MRAQAIEKLLTLIAGAVDDLPFRDDVFWSEEYKRLSNLKAKAHILLNREDNRAASVIRELMNNEV